MFFWISDELFAGKLRFMALLCIVERIASAKTAAAPEIFTRRERSYLVMAALKRK